MRTVPSLLASSLLLGCSDYRFKAKEFGALSVEPTSLEIAAACEYEEHTVTLQSVGDFAVTVREVGIDGSGWTLLDTPSLPRSLEPGERMELVLLGTEGEATLRISSDDPDGMLRRVPLVGAPNAAPSIDWVSPGADVILEADTTLEVQVTDVDGPTDGLLVEWGSDVDGSLGLVYSDATGSASTEWSAASPGDHQLTASVIDSCGALASATLSVCQQAGFYTESLDLTTWTIGGDARYDEDNDWVELTDATGLHQLGSAFQSTPTRGDNVMLAFSFYVSGGTGADGFALTALDTDRATAYIAQSGGCLGYGGGGVCGAFDPLYGWNVEVDTFFSPDLDPTEEDHVSFHFDGDVAGYEAYAALPEMEDDSWHEMVVEVVAPRVTIAIDGVVYIDEEIDGYYDFPAEVGFTAATGGETNFHLIDGLQVIERVCDDD